MFSRFGSSVAALGDVDVDGVRDLAIGDPDDSESMCAPDDFQHATGSAHVVSGATGLRLWMAFGGRAVDRFGYCVASAGDVDGDGRDDVLAMAPGPLGWERADPWFRVHSGVDGKLVHELTLPPRSGSEPPPTVK